MQKKVINVNNKQLIALEWNGQRVITTAQLAEVYGTDINNVQANFSRNIERFREDIHYFLLKGDKLKQFKNYLTDSQLVAKNTSQLYLWTRRGASRHCKILDTERAWEQFDALEESYFKPFSILHSPIYAYPVSPAAGAAAAELGRVTERIMRAQGSSPYKIAAVFKLECEQLGIELPADFVEIPLYEQLTLEEMITG